jgi:hypothetical protein
MLACLLRAQNQVMTQNNNPYYPDISIEDINVNFEKIK